MAAAQNPEPDPAQAAMRGRTFSGYLAAAAVLRHPEVFLAAVAGGVPTGPRLRDTHWEERLSATRMYFRRTTAAVHCSRRQPG
ncbi:hypothetical protein ACFTXM_01500 [Streptomyces sp. NPDC056930]|uniref:hypothetical protein n=1 Tax=Streptomyces sp. NPDC056930 TaxID=3345967 RepID=UPI003638553D